MSHSTHYDATVGSLGIRTYTYQLMTNNKAIEDFHPLMCSLEVLHAEASTKLIRTQWKKIISLKTEPQEI
jgi:hypothetical protein